MTTMTISVTPTPRGQLQTRGKGVACFVNNPLNFEFFKLKILLKQSMDNAEEINITFAMVSKCFGAIF